MSAEIERNAVLRVVKAIRAVQPSFFRHVVLNFNHDSPVFDAFVNAVMHELEKPEISEPDVFPELLANARREVREFLGRDVDMMKL